MAHQIAPELAVGQVPHLHPHTSPYSAHSRAYVQAHLNKSCKPSAYSAHRGAYAQAHLNKSCKPVHKTTGMTADSVTVLRYRYQHTYSGHAFTHPHSDMIRGILLLCSDRNGRKLGCCEETVWPSNLCWTVSTASSSKQAACICQRLNRSHRNNC